MRDHAGSPGWNPLCAVCQRPEASGHAAGRRISELHLRIDRGGLPWPFAFSQAKDSDDGGTAAGRDGLACLEGASSSEHGVDPGRPGLRARRGLGVAGRRLLARRGAGRCGHRDRPPCHGSGHCSTGPCRRLRTRQPRASCGVVAPPRGDRRSGNRFPATRGERRRLRRSLRCCPPTRGALAGGGGTGAGLPGCGRGPGRFHRVGMAVVPPGAARAGLWRLPRPSPTPTRLGSCWRSASWSPWGANARGSSASSSA